MDGQKNLMIIAGEVSGDMHAAAIVRAIRQQVPDINVFGIGGVELRQAGMEIIFDAQEMAVLGLNEVLRKYFFFRRVLNTMLKLARERRPDVILLVDYPGFNLRFAAAARALGLKVVYYVCPQVWAWNRGRIPKMAHWIDRLLTIFPFEPALFEKTGLVAEFVGHPFVTATDEARRAPDENLPWQSGTPRLALLPGSRRHEIQRLLPAMLDTAKLLEQKFSGLACIVAAPSDDAARRIAGILAEVNKVGAGPKRLAVTVGRTRAVLRQATAAMVASGTATVETALMRCPMVIIYRVAAATYWVGRLLIRVPFLGMVNILWQRLYPQEGKKALCPEFIQQAVVPASIAAALTPLLTGTVRRNEMLAGLERVSAALGAGVGAERAVAAVLEEMRS